MSKNRIGLALLLAAVWTTGAWALPPSVNLIGGGTFEGEGFGTGSEDLESFIKINDSPLTPEEVAAGTDPVRAWQFHPAFDSGKWIGMWGITAQNDPRTAWYAGQPVAPENRSVVTRDGQPNGVMEGALFRGHMTQIIKAPVNHVAGTATIDFDYWFNQWEETPQAGDSILHVWIGGFNEASLPSWEDRAGPIFGGSQAELDAMGATHLWSSPDWNTWGWGGIGSEEEDIGSQGLEWHSLSVTNADRTTFEITTPFDYYYVSVWLTVYSEPHPWFWLYGQEPADAMAAAVDNMDFRLAVLRGDFNGDGLVTLSDINPFKLALTDITAWQAAYPDLDIGNIDPSGDGLVTLSDINPFKALLTGGSGADTPEPATASLLAIGALALIRRR
ncbi:MAG: hypothetical protein IT443_03200 [Phycisphaeraceae bacterium]|nr:hypothetical protein [Phycisphaeraceae bacterium]